MIIAKLHAYVLSINACDLSSSYLCNKLRPNASKSSKFQFMIISHNGVDASNATLQIDDNIVLKPEPQVNVLGVMLNGKLNCNRHVSAYVPRRRGNKLPLLAFLVF